MGDVNSDSREGKEEGDKGGRRWWRVDGSRSFDDVVSMMGFMRSFDDDDDDDDYIMTKMDTVRVGSRLYFRIVFGKIVSDISEAQ
ncbi:hypothetical protein L1987_33320 [Smallanthus sonchifolius]|uniref:Uncharacterized protein n=1 Tax=Smallanthus sonchifolius TaxID=185202 RepID=A0ACB9HQ12_9ASTR|nr:hypothetical protein L1987_33320 [Smallanthus sonchifolius]